MKSFEFNLESHGRISKPMKYELKDPKLSYAHLSTHLGPYLVEFDSMLLNAKDDYEKPFSCYTQFDDNINYHHIDQPLCKRKFSQYGWNMFILKRLIVIQMK